MPAWKETHTLARINLLIVGCALAELASLVQVGCEIASGPLLDL